MNMFSVFISSVIVLLAVYLLGYISMPLFLKIRLAISGSSLPLTIIKKPKDGAKGPAGKDSLKPVTKPPGNPGKQTAAGGPGPHGPSGPQGPSGPGGNHGGHGGDGVDGNNGVPGSNVIHVKDKLFDTTIEPVHYINGLPISEHLESVTNNKKDQFKQHKSKLSERISNTFISTYQRNYFLEVLNNLMENAPIPDVDQHKLDTLEKFDKFLDEYIAKYKTLNDGLKATKVSKTMELEEKNRLLGVLRGYRKKDLEKINSTDFIKATREHFITPKIDLAPNPSNYLDALNELKNDPSVTFDSQVRALTNDLNTARNTYESDKTETNRDAVSMLIDQINTIKVLKHTVNADLIYSETAINDAYKNGTTPPNKYSFTFNNYGMDGMNPITGGAMATKQSIVTLTNEISDNENNFMNNVNSYSNDYINANPV